MFEVTKSMSKWLVTYLSLTFLFFQILVPIDQILNNPAFNITTVIHLENQKNPTMNNQTVTTFFVEEPRWEDLTFIPVKMLFEGHGLEMNELFLTFISAKQILGCSLSLICVVFNAILLCFLASKEQFRSWVFCPLAFQATVDILGPGIANFFYEIYYYDSMVTQREARLSTFGYAKVSPGSLTLIKILRFRPIGCVMTYLREFLNEFSTGFCILTTAFFRYLAVCHPLYRPSKFFHRRISLSLMALVLLSLTAITADLMFNSYIYGPLTNQER